MSETLLSSRNLAFELYEVLDAEALTQRPRFAEHSRETFDAALGTARSLAEKLFAPHNRKGDEHEPLYENGSATLIPEVKPAVDAFLDAGFLNATRSFEQGGMQLPTLLSQACFAHFQAANVGSSAYPFLTMGAANLIESFGSEEQKQRFLQPMIEGRFFGTMALTEPHAGSSLSDIRTRAEPAADGSYRIKGNKIFISGGDHPLSENIVHMVLASCRMHRRGERHLAVHRAEVPGQRRRQPRAAQRRDPRRPVPQDGLSRHHLHRAELRRKRRLRRLPGGQAAPRPGLHVPDDERGAHRRRHGAR